MSDRLDQIVLRCVALSCVGGALACGGSQPSQVPDRDARSRDQPAMHTPPAHAPAAQAELGTLQPIATAEHPEPAQPSVKPLARKVTPIRVANSPAPEPYALRDRDLVMPGGLVIHNVPRGVTVRTVAELDSKAPVLEFVDAHGRRLALLKETALARATLASGAPLLEATTAAHDQSPRDDWQKTRVNVVTDRFQSDTHLYMLERRSSGTDWIMSGLELVSHH